MSTTRGLDVAQAEIALDAPAVRSEKDDGKMDVSVHSTEESVKEKSFMIDEHGNALIEPTPEELATLRRVADKLPYAAFSVVIVELCERFAFYGLSGPFQNYLQNPLPPGSRSGAPPKGFNGAAGALNRSQSEATGLQNMFSVSTALRLSLFYPESMLSSWLTLLLSLALSLPTQNGDVTKPSPYSAASTSLVY